MRNGAIPSPVELPIPRNRRIFGSSLAEELPRFAATCSTRSWENPRISQIASISTWNAPEIPFRRAILSLSAKPNLPFP